MRNKTRYNKTRTCIIDTPLGQARAAAKNRALTGLWFVGQKHFPADTESWIESPGYSVFKDLQLWLTAYFAGKNIRPQLRMDPQGTPFQVAVWDRLRKIPRGQVTTYGAIAKNMAGKKGPNSASARAVGGAVGRNPISILIPCHRVVGSDGSLIGYAGGLERKKELLRREGLLSLAPPLKADHRGKGQG
jgi:methylated-DNA-[protein]-cysteine S-methyltransferase